MKRWSRTANCARHFLIPRGFDPAGLDRFAVIRFPFDFRDGDGLVPKRFVVLGHAHGTCVCAKTTSNVDRHYSDATIMAGVVFYEAGDVGCFEVPTAVEPGNVFAIPHADLLRYARNNQLEILDVLTDDIKERMETAIAACTTIVPPRKRKLIAIINGEQI